MKKYANHSNSMQTVTFDDGTSQFLMRGQSITTDKEVKSVGKGIKVSSVRKSKIRTTSTNTEEDNQG